MDPRLRAIAESAKGFMPPDEGRALYEAAMDASGVLLEIGSYCGKSAVYLGAAARQRCSILFSIDHHRGSEEIQPGWDHHDPELVDDEGRMDSLPFFRRTIADAQLEDVVIAIVGDSPTVAARWATQLGFVFIDGAHSEVHALADYDGWAGKLAPNGLLAIHDVFDDPSRGGQGPFRAYERAKRDGFTDVSRTGSLRVLRKP